MKRFLIYLLCLMPMVAQAKIIYRTQQTGSVPGAKVVESKDTFADRHRVYVGAMYDFSMWQNYDDGENVIHGANESGFDGLIGFRLSDIFRLEADYMYNRAKWSSFSMNTHTIFFNAIVDARVDSLYRMFYNQKLVPYVGAGAGLTFYDAKGLEFGNDTNASLAAMAGLGVELGEHFTLDFGYRYVYMFKPSVDMAPNLSPSAHQIRLGARINF